jgi:amino acid transporter/nucleotide-binding universal stress UspA family protein
MKKFDTEVHLSREMKLFDVTMIGVGAMIGAGIFVLTGIAAGVAGPALIIAFGLNAVVALLTAMSYAELGSCYHDAGGGYLWVKEGLPKWNGFLSGWMSWFAHAVACSLYALGFGAYFDHVLREFGILLPQWGLLSPQKLLAVGIAMVFAYINFRGASETGKIGNFVTMLKIVILAIFIGFGLELILRRGDAGQAFVPFMPNGWGGVIKAMGLTFIAFQGFEVISQCSEEVKNPKKNIPRAVFLSLAIVVPIYLLVAVTSLASVRPEGGMTPWDYLAMQKETALVGVAQTFFAGGGIMLLVGGIISTMSALNATVYSSSRVAFAMGRDRNFPTLFSKVHAGKFTPHYAIFFSTIIVILMSVSLQIEDVASAADIMFLLLFLQVNVTMIRLRKKRPDLDRGFFTPLFPYLTILGIILLLFLALYMFNYSPMGWFVTAAWIGGGLLVYRFYASNREVEHVRKVQALERLEKKDFTILVPLAHPESAAGLLSIAIAIAQKHDGEIVLLHVLEVDQGVPLQAGMDASKQAIPFLDRARSTIEAAEIPVRSIIKVSHRISQSILETALDEEANFVILGRDQHPGFLDRVNGSVLDTVLDKAPCEIAVLHGILKPKKVFRILIPFGENIHTRLACEIAPALVEYFKCTAHIVVVTDPDSPDAPHAGSIEKARSIASESGLAAHFKEIRRKGIKESIVQQSKGADLVVMGGRSGSLLGLVFGQSLTQEITEQSACPVLWINEYEEQPSFWRLLFTRSEREAEEHHG